MDNQYLKNIFDAGKADKIIGLNRHGEEIKIILERGKKNGKIRHFPVVVDNYHWTRKDQISRATKFRDRIEYLYFPEEDKNHPMMPIWRKDDTARLKAILSIPFGKRVLETGCSSGTVSIEIAKLPKVKKVLGIDLRPDAIALAKKLVKQLVKRGDLGKKHGDKLDFSAIAIEDLEENHGLFDTVCAFEVLEHIKPDLFEEVVLKIKSRLVSEGSFLVSVPNRYPAEELIKANRVRWSAPDHKNYFSLPSLRHLLSKSFRRVKFHSVDGFSPDRGVYLLAECR